MNAETQNEMERLDRVNREQQALLGQIYQYVDEQGLAKLGQSRVKALIEAHKRASAERDAETVHVQRLYKALEELVEQCGHPNISGWVNIERAVSALAKARSEL